MTGVACLPAYRRRGLATAVTSALVADAIALGVDTVCLSAGDDDIARVYERVGFRHVGRVGEAEFAAGSGAWLGWPMPIIEIEAFAPAEPFDVRACARAGHQPRGVLPG